tara:strand:+ start:237 stop:1418 length:1182 start_codon:yes stop_codon:yes gene_type:complete
MIATDLSEMPQATRPAARIECLVLTDFRNYAQLRLEPAPRSVVLTGANGAGKTNLLEAVSFLAPGRGLRRAHLGEVTRRGAPAMARWAVAARLDLPGGTCDIGTGLESGAAAGERRQVRIDGESARGQAGLGERLGVSWLTPAMDRLFTEAPGGRRRFFDRLVVGLMPGHGRELAAYERGLRERARLLASGGEGRWLDVVEETLAAHGVAVAAARRETLGQLQAALAEASDPFPRPSLAIVGEIEGWLDDMAAVDAEHRFAGLLRDSRLRDAESGHSIHGPHRSNLSAHHLAHDMPAGECSTGEQKALLVSIILAEARLRVARSGAPPLLLLDEVAAHLDANRRAALAEALIGLGAQAWLTGTDAELFEHLGGQATFYTVADDSVSTREYPSA